MESTKIKVTRWNIAYGYFFEMYESVDGARKGRGLTEVWIGKDNEPFKDFILQADFSENGQIDRDYLLSNVFGAAIVDYNSKYDVAENQETLPFEGFGERIMEYEVTRVYLRDDYYIELDSLDIWDDEEEVGEDEEPYTQTVTIGKVNGQVRVGLCDVEIDMESSEEELNVVYEELLSSVEGELDEIFQEEANILDISVRQEEEEVREYGVYYSLSDDEDTVSHLSEEDEIKF